MASDPSPEGPQGRGVLYVVCTPIGNLEDLSPRARRILGEVSLVAAEDTRRTRELLSALGIHTPLMSLHAHNERARTAALTEALASGKDVALVTDAGAPTVSDPGGVAIAEAIEQGIPIVPIPGPSAVIAALSAAGLPTERFLFLGFLPPKESRRRKALEAVSGEPGSLVLFEGKSRIIPLLRDVASVLGPRRVAVGRELTKLHEELLRGSAAEIADALEARPQVLGEFTVVIEGAPEGAGAVAPVSVGEAEGLKDLAAEVARVMGVKKRDAYQALLALKG